MLFLEYITRFLSLFFSIFFNIKMIFSSKLFKEHFLDVMQKNFENKIGYDL